MDITAIASANLIVIMRFALGFIGSLVYFVSVKSGFVKTERVPKAYENPYLQQWHTVLFFCLIGGLLAVLFEANRLGSFTAGILVRPTIKELLTAGKRRD
ncbi:hypothetical protein HY995_04585 [Candidatus Micrarchaeota archaeon]|nr:hypothetical protein [Candidatus Micrarchaeota archaeon]MBI5177332.1 hypothetical protein [Candidatus Micrarchaeota archaeon]